MTDGWIRGSIARAVRLGVGLVLCAPAAGSEARAAAPDAPEARIARGRTLFLREWVPGEPSDPGGDGLGPVYNETSCVACHDQGGVAGGGPASRNVDLIVAAATTDIDGGKGLPGRDQASGPDRDALIDLHAGFRGSTSVVLHRFGTDGRHEPWRLFVLDPRRGVLVRGPSGKSEVQLHQVPGNRGAADQALLAKMGMNRTPSPNPVEHGDFTLFHFQRNPIALFGAGLIDAVPDAVLEAAARRRFAGFPEITGRVSRLPDGRIGRFGWKAQEATLEEFVLTACAVELGLEVPGRHQAGNPRDGAYRAPGLDLTPEQCQDLVAFVRSLPAPAEHTSATSRDAEAIVSGRATFERIGCAACHVPRLGEVEGAYSDLLLHDLGEDLGEIGSYGVTIPDPGAAAPASDERSSRGEPAGAAARREWRTSPLWGLRDSGPYLHHGRAETLEQAIALHGGEAQATAERYFCLAPRERWRVQAFLKSLGAPPGGTPGGAERGLPAAARPIEVPQPDRTPSQSSARPLDAVLARDRSRSLPGRAPGRPPLLPSTPGPSAPVVPGNTATILDGR